MDERAAGALIGPVWCIGWLFTIGYAKLLWWQAIFALALWPYYLGVAVRPGEMTAEVSPALPCQPNTDCHPIDGVGMPRARDRESRWGSLPCLIVLRVPE